MTFIEMITIWMLSLSGQPVDQHDCARPEVTQTEHATESKKTQTEKKGQAPEGAKASGFQGGNQRKISNGL